MVNVNKNVNIFSVNSNHHRTSGTRTYTRAMGQHSVFSQAGWHGAARSFNAYDTHTVNLNRYSRMREGLNNRWDNYEHYHHGPQGPQEQNPSLLETLMVAIPLGKLIFDFGKDIAKTFNIGGGKKTGDVKGGNGADPGDGIPKNNTFDVGDITNVNSFKDIDKLQTQNDKELKKFSDSYAKISVKEDVDKYLNEDVKNTLSGLNITLDTSKLSLEQINLTGKNVNLGAEIEKITADITDIEAFNNELSTNIESVGTELGCISATLDTAKEQLKLERKKDPQNATEIANLEKKIEELTKQETQLKEAQNALNAIKTKSDACLTELKNKETEAKTLKDNDDKIKDQRYELAKSKDEKLEKNYSEITKLQDQLENEPDKAKQTEINKKLATYYNESATLMEELQSLGGKGTKIKKADGTTHTIKMGETTGGGNNDHPQLNNYDFGDSNQQQYRIKNGSITDENYA